MTRVWKHLVLYFVQTLLKFHCPDFLRKLRISSPAIILCEHCKIMVHLLLKSGTQQREQSADDQATSWRETRENTSEQAIFGNLSRENTLELRSQWLVDTWGGARGTGRSHMSKHTRLLSAESLPRSRRNPYKPSRNCMLWAQRHSHTCKLLVLLPCTAVQYSVVELAG
jgi:hypothetical protein